jgi:hypothetical protein
MSIDEEKKSDSITEDVVAVTNDSDDFRLLTAENRKAGERSLIRKLDSRLMPTAVVIYLLNYIDVCHFYFMKDRVLTFCVACRCHCCAAARFRGRPRVVR